MTSLDSFLDDLASGDGWIVAWDDVLARASIARDQASVLKRPRTSRGRVAAIILTVIAAALIPLIAVAATNDWWFLRHPVPQTTPARAPVVVKRGDFAGKQWQIVAYPAAAGGLCWSLTFTVDASNGSGSALGCGAIVGFPSHRPNAEMTITFLASGGDEAFPPWVMGPVVATATTVKIRLGTHTMRTRTFAAPDSLGTLAFYAAQLPSNWIPRFRPDSGQRPPRVVTWVAGYDDRGRIVACLNPQDARDGISPLPSCR